MLRKSSFPAFGKAACALLCALAVTGAAADDKRYEGLLLPEDFGGGISVVVELRDLHGVLVGTVKGGSPYNGIGKITAGDMVGDKCDFTATFNPTLAVRFMGSCGVTAFEGRYAQIGRREAGTRGSFRLQPKAPEPDEEKRDTLTHATSVGSVTECITANARCLSFCPQGDYNTEFLCANRCRTKYRACKKAVAP